VVTRRRSTIATMVLSAVEVHVSLSACTPMQALASALMMQKLTHAHTTTKSGRTEQKLLTCCCGWGVALEAAAAGAAGAVGAPPPSSSSKSLLALEVVGAVLSGASAGGRGMRGQKATVASFSTRGHNMGMPTRSRRIISNTYRAPTLAFALARWRAIVLKQFTKTHMQFTLPLSRCVCVCVHAFGCKEHTKHTVLFKTNTSK